MTAAETLALLARIEADPNLDCFSGQAMPPRDGNHFFGALERLQRG